MKVIQHVKQLLRQGKKPRELRELGFSKVAITRARRQLKEERASERAGTPKQGYDSTSRGQTQSPVAKDKVDLAQLEDEVDILKLWVYILQDTHCLQGFACPQCVDGHLCWKEWQDGDARDGAYVCDVCGYQPPTLPESRQLWQQDTE